MNHQVESPSLSDCSWWQPVLFAALAGGMAWGIRGQYGHETGAMIAGLLVSLTLVFLLCPGATLLRTFRAIAWCTVAMGIGGSMTYGQTVGLTHDAPLHGHWAALRWGMLGLSIKGALWIGFAGAFLGIGLGGKRYTLRELIFLMLALIAAYFLGVYWLNSPFDPAHKQLPAIYFSDHWYWEPEGNIKPRPECWGGLLLGLGIVLAYTRIWRKDILAFRLGLWGILGGAIGFPLGQSLQAYHAWNVESIRSGFLSAYDPFINWWNMMETTYGAVMGGTLGLGLWLNRNRIGIKTDQAFEPSNEPFLLGEILVVIHLVLLAAVEFLSVPLVDAVYDIGIIMVTIPVIAIGCSRWWPYFVVFPITLFPIAGKTVRQLVYREMAIDPSRGWLLYFIIPLVVAVVTASWYARQDCRKPAHRNIIGFALLLNAWMYFLLNYAFFRFPWPWAEWTGRTPNGIIFTICVVGLTVMVFWKNTSENQEPKMT